MPAKKLIDAKKAIAQGRSPALEKQREKRRLTAAKIFREMIEEWLAGARIDDSTKAMRKSTVDRDILPAFENRQLKRTDPGHLGRGRFRERNLDHSETSHEGAQPARGLWKYSVKETGD